MASRKAAEINKAWDKATTTLEKAIKVGQTQEIDPVDLKGIQEDYETWEGLLKEATHKSEKWDEKPGKEQDLFVSNVKFQKSKGKRFGDDLKKIEVKVTAANGKQKLVEAALVRIRSHYRLEVTSELKELENLVVKTQHAIVLENLGLAKKNYAIITHKLASDFSDISSPSAFAKNVKELAASLKVTAELDDDKELQALFKAANKTFKMLSGVAATLHSQIGDLEDDLAEGDPETASTDPDYKANLKSLKDMYVKVVKDLRADVTEASHQFDHITKVQMMAKALQDPKGLDHVLTEIERTGRDLHDAARDFDELLKHRVRASNSEIQKKTKEWKIAPHDATRMLAPILQRVKVMGSQITNIHDNGATKLTRVLSDLSVRFGTPEIKGATVRFQSIMSR